METKTTILVVDDERRVEKMFMRKFHKHPEFAWHFAFDGKEAIEALHAHPDTKIIFTDLNMPNMDGMALLKHLAKTYFDGHVVVISAYGDYERRREAMQHGAFDILGKPIIWQDLEATIGRALKMQAQISKLEAQNRQLSDRVQELKRKLMFTYVRIQELESRNPENSP